MLDRPTFLLRTISQVKMTASLDTEPCSFIALILEAVRTSEKLVYFNETTRS
jgi:hypothetical protein